MIRKNIDIAAVAVLLVSTALFARVWDNWMVPKLVRNQIAVSSGILRVYSIPVCPYLRVVFR